MYVIYIILESIERELNGSGANWRKDVHHIHVVIFTHLGTKVIIRWSASHPLPYPENQHYLNVKCKHISRFDF